MPSPIIFQFSLNSDNKLHVNPFGVTNQITIKGLFFDGTTSTFVLSGGGVSFSNFIVTEGGPGEIEGTFEAWGLLFPGSMSTITVDVFSIYGQSTHAFEVGFPLAIPDTGPPPPAPAPAPVPIPAPTTPTPRPSSFTLNPNTPDHDTLLTAPGDGAANSITVWGNTASPGTGFTANSVLFTSDDDETITFPSQRIPMTLNADGSLSCNFNAVSANDLDAGSARSRDGTTTILTVTIGNPTNSSPNAPVYTGFSNDTVETEE